MTCVQMEQMDQQMEWAEACSLAASDNSAGKGRPFRRPLKCKSSLPRRVSSRKNYGQEVDHGQHSNLRPLWSAGQETDKGQYSVISILHGQNT